MVNLTSAHRIDHPIILGVEDFAVIVHHPQVWSCLQRREGPVIWQPLVMGVHPPQHVFHFDGVKLARSKHDVD